MGKRIVTKPMELMMTVALGVELPLCIINEVTLHNAVLPDCP